MTNVYCKTLDSLPTFSVGSLLSIDLETFGFKNQFELDFSPIASIFGVQPMHKPAWFNQDGKAKGYRPALDVLANQVRICSVLEEGSDTVYVIDVARVGYKTMIELMSGHPLMGHNLSFDLTIMFRLGLPDPPYVRCTSIAGRVLLAGVKDVDPKTGVGKPKSVALGNLLNLMLGVVIDKNLGGGAKSDWANLELTNDQILYAGNDVQYLLPLYSDLKRRIDGHGMTVANDLEQDCIIPLTRMELEGMTVDVQQWTERTTKTGERVDKLRAELKSLLPPVPSKVLNPRPVRLKKDGKPYKKDLLYNQRAAASVAPDPDAEWNVNSWMQVRDAMSLVGVSLPPKLDVPKFVPLLKSVHVAKHAKPVQVEDFEETEKAWAFDEEYADRDGKQDKVREDDEVPTGQLRVKTDRVTLTLLKHLHPSIPVILKLRDARKEFTAHGMKWLHEHLRGDKVYADWHQLGTLTGRMSVSNPNLQQMPRGNVRRGIIAPEGYLLVRADYSQIEVRIAAKISEDPLLLEIFQTNRDVHEETAKMVLGLDAVSPEQRQIGKSLVFGLLYSMSAKSLRVYCAVNFGVDLTLEQAELFRTRFFEAYKGMAAWHKREKNRSYSTDETRTLIGRRRWIKQEMDNRFGLCLNSPVQGTGADMLKIAVANWYPGFRHGERLVAMVHDELIFVVPEDRAKGFSVELREHMIRVGAGIIDPVPCDASIKISKTWGG